MVWQIWISIKSGALGDRMGMEIVFTPCISHRCHSEKLKPRAKSFSFGPLISAGSFYLICLIFMSDKMEMSAFNRWISEIFDHLDRWMHLPTKFRQTHKNFPYSIFISLSLFQRVYWISPFAKTETTTSNCLFLNFSYHLHRFEWFIGSAWSTNFGLQHPTIRLRIFVSFLCF
jgi:hypothetical protein